MIEKFRKLIEDAGGYVHPDLILLVGEEAEHGEVSLAGVPNTELAARVPSALYEHFNSPGVWCKFCEEQGQVIDRKWFLERELLPDIVVPIISAANHSNSSTTGNIINTGDSWELYGTTISYGKDSHHLKRYWGIIE